MQLQMLVTNVNQIQKSNCKDFSHSLRINSRKR